MLELSAALRPWSVDGRSFAIGTVVAVHGSAPREPGAALAVDADGEAVGGVSGGCVEAAVYELCTEAIRTGHPAVEWFGPDADPDTGPDADPDTGADAGPQLRGRDAAPADPRTPVTSSSGDGHMSPDDGHVIGPPGGTDPFAPALTCGGSLQVLVTPLTARSRSGIAAAFGAVAAGRPTALVRCVAGRAAAAGGALAVIPGDQSGVHGTLGYGPGLDRAAEREARAALATGTPGAVTVSDDGGDTLLVETHVPAPQLLLVGAVEVAADLARAATLLGLRPVVCDPRPVFATRARFPDADEVTAAWPHHYLDAQPHDPRAAVCVLTHDPRIDVPVLVRALRRPLAYVGALGSRRTHTERLARLRAAGLTDGELSHLHSPIGLDLGGRTPGETALAIAAGIVAARHGGTGRPLRTTTGALHRRTPAVAPRGG